VIDLAFQRHPSGGLIGTLGDGTTSATIGAAEVDRALADVLLAVDEAQRQPFSECFWPVPGGEYRWMFRRNGDEVTVVVLWSAGTVPGWQHVFRAECDYRWLVERLRAELAILDVEDPRA